MFFFLHYGNTLDASKGKKKILFIHDFSFFSWKKNLKIKSSFRSTLELSL